MTAGQSAGNIDAILPAGEIVRRMTSEAKAASMSGRHEQGCLTRGLNRGRERRRDR